MNPEDMIGKMVTKKSNKPFKSGLRTNTVTGVIQHPITGEPAFTFEEDDTYVSVIQCKEASWTKQHEPPTPPAGT